MLVPMDSLSIFTSVTESRGHLREEQDTTDGEFVAFVSQPWSSFIWKERPAYDRFASPERNARAPKILAHHFVTATCSIWLEANISLKVPASLLVEEWLKECDLATFAHQKRSCTYDEAVACANQGLDSSRQITEQMTRYRQLGLPEQYGLPEPCVIARRHTRRVEEFNNLWWSEWCRYSIHEHLSMAFAAHQTGLKINLVTPHKMIHPYIKRASREPWRERSPANE